MLTFPLYRFVTSKHNWLLFVVCILHTPAHADFAEMSPQRVNEIAAKMSEQPHGFGPTCSDRESWKNPIILQRTTAIRQSAEKLLKQNFPAWDQELYLEYSRNGARPNGEKMMNARKAWLYPLVIAECVDGQGRFLPAIERTLTELVDQPTWTWPAHDRSLRNVRDHHYEVDLMAADTAHDLAQALFMLGDSIKPELRRKTQLVINERVFEPLRKSFSTGNKDNFWLHADHNWNAVCLKGSVAAALTILPEKYDRAVFAAAAEYYIQNYVHGFTDDGYTTEGPGYWNYGFSHFVMLREILQQATNGTLDIFSDAKVRNMAMYGYRIEMFPDNIAAFGDAPTNTHMDDFTRAYANEVLNLGQTQRLANIDMGSGQSGNDAPLARTALLLFVTPHQANEHSHVEQNNIGLHSYFKSVGVLVSRPSPLNTLSISIKTGGNENHSHNDVGSYTIGISTEQPTGDVGRTQYSAKTFSKERYTIPGINSWGHPVPVVAGELQVEADKIKPRVISTHFSDNIDEIKINMADAYSAKALKSLTRTMVHDRRNFGSITMTDRFDFTSPNRFEVALTTLGNWKQNDDGTIELWQKKEHLITRVEASDSWKLKAENSNEEGLNFTRIAVYLVSPRKSGYIKLHFETLHP